ncbi:Killer cell lectin-like receptor 6, partial [Lemmus lemmus]
QAREESSTCPLLAGLILFHQKSQRSVKVWFKKKHTLHTIEMSDEEITYSTVRFGKSSKLQNRGRPEETQGPKGAVHRECSVTWHLIAIPLGILGFFLLVAVAVLLTYVFQYSEKNNELQKTLNSLTQQYHTLQNNNTIMEEKLRNKYRELDDLKCQKEIDSSTREQNRCCWETKVLDCIQLTGKYVDGYWFCSPIKCYFIMGNKHWRGCKQTCQDCSLSLLKIEDDDELRFLQFKVKPNTYWIGLSFDAGKSNWQWIDEDSSNL